MATNKKIKINETVCDLKKRNPRDFYARLNTGVVNTFLWSNGAKIIINLN